MEGHENGVAPEGVGNGRGPIDNVGNNGLTDLPVLIGLPVGLCYRT
jgi:hypothetical protein